MLEPKLPTGSALYLDGGHEYRRLRGAGSALRRSGRQVDRPGPPEVLPRVPRGRLVRRAGPRGNTTGQHLKTCGRTLAHAALGPTRSRSWHQNNCPMAAHSSAKRLPLVLESSSATLKRSISLFELGAPAWRPRNKYEAYKYGIEDLIREMNRVHSGRGSSAIAASTLWTPLPQSAARPYWDTPSASHAGRTNATNSTLRRRWCRSTHQALSMECWGVVSSHRPAQIASSPVIVPLQNSSLALTWLTVFLLVSQLAVSWL